MPTNNFNQNPLTSDGQNYTSFSSSDTFNTANNYNFNLSNRSSYNPGMNDYASATANSTSTYSPLNGYGLINAAAAVSQATGESPYSDVANLGGNNWGLDMINAPEVWGHGYIGQGIIVAVIDTGVDANHQSLKDNIWTNTKEIAGNGIDDDGNGYVDDVNGWNFNDNNNNTLDNNDHGTHVAGIIAGENNGLGVTGVAYNAKIMAVKAMDASGAGSYSAIASGIRYAVDNGARVLNLSLGGDFSSQTLQSALEYADSKGAIVVMASGNEGKSEPGYPARYADKSGIAVGAVDINKNLTDFSNRSGSTQLAYVTAPGQNVYSSIRNNQYASYSGTSMATPYVAGVVALMLSANPNLTVAQVRDIITSTAGNKNGDTTPTTPTTPITSPGFNFDPSPFLGLIGTPSNSNAQATIARTNSGFNFDFRSFAGDMLTGLALNNTSSYNLKSFLENNTLTEIFHIASTFASPAMQFVLRYYQDSLPNSLANSPTDINNPNNLDFGKIINQIVIQLQEYQKLLGR